MLSPSLHFHHLSIWYKFSTLKHPHQLHPLLIHYHMMVFFIQERIMTLIFKLETDNYLLSHSLNRQLCTNLIAVALLLLLLILLLLLLHF
mmetsp:Transcript_16383/g.26180  ORF Transcript_16383/g.26180 Transcript_16383/m.26180 type:complete len:90 (+) Transcript_16383:84-353(+)